MKKADGALRWLAEFLSDKEDPEEPHYDPVHLGGAVIVTLTAMGCLYWLLWTLLVFEGGIFRKIRALDSLAGGARLKDLGWGGYPYAMGEFEGIVGNFIALILCVAVVIAVRQLYRQAARTHHRA